LCQTDLNDLQSESDLLVVRGKGGKVRDVPLAPGVRRAMNEWLRCRGFSPGPLITPVSRWQPEVVILRAMSPSAVAKVVHQLFGPHVSPHDLRRTAVGDLLDAGADLSVVARIIGHSNPAVTARYDRRGLTALRSAVDRLHVPHISPVPTDFP
jgi:site-specific recombinase XerC